MDDVFGRGKMATCDRGGFRFVGNALDGPLARSRTTTRLQRSNDQCKGDGEDWEEIAHGVARKSLAL